jgi:hypothetical protein
MTVFFNFVHVPSAMEDNNTESITKWRWLRPVETACEERTTTIKENIGMLICLF